jgi:hypothetical protein
MSTGRLAFRTFLDDLRGKTVAIVYSFSNRVEPSVAWYDRWRSDVIVFFGRGVERLGAEPRYMDVETYIKAQGSRGEGPGDFVVNLHSGLNDLGCWPIISSLARWRRIPVAPCSSDVHIVGERKDLANMLAAQAGLRVPQPFADECEPETLFVRKPRDLGMSRGLRILPRSELDSDAFGSDIVQRLIPGYDATVGVVRTPDGNYAVIGAQLLVPAQMGDTGWVFSEESKIAEDSGSASFSRRIVDVGQELSRMICDVCNRIGPSGHYRLDFRIQTSDPVGLACLTPENAYFLEANPTPTVTGDGEFGAMVSDWLEAGGLKDSAGEATAEHLRSLGREATLVALDLFSAARDLSEPRADVG